MKRFIFLNLVLGFLLIALDSCNNGFTPFEPDSPYPDNSTGKGNSSSSGDASSATSEYFPEPSFSWGCSLSNLKSNMTKKGYEYEGEIEHSQIFRYNNRLIRCAINNDLYTSCYSGDVTSSEVQHIIENYKKSCNVIGEKDSYAMGFHYDVLITKDNKTLIVGEVGLDNNTLNYIEFYSMDYASSNCSFVISLVQ